MLPISIDEDTLAQFGSVWIQNGGNLKRTPPFSSVETLERLARRTSVDGPPYMAESIALVVWDPETGTISSDVPNTSSALRIEKFSEQVEAMYVARYKGLPPHADEGT
jgi:hypothetical protein